MELNILNTQDSTGEHYYNFCFSYDKIKINVNEPNLHDWESLLDNLRNNKDYSESFGGGNSTGTISIKPSISSVVFEISLSGGGDDMEIELSIPIDKCINAFEKAAAFDFD